MPFLRLLRLLSRLVAFSSFIVPLYHPFDYMSRGNFGQARARRTKSGATCPAGTSALIPHSLIPYRLILYQFRVVLVAVLFRPFRERVTLGATVRMCYKVTSAFTCPFIFPNRNRKTTQVPDFSCLYPLAIAIRFVEVVPIIPLFTSEGFTAYIAVAHG
jgi:hypothetical protein